MTGGAQFWTEQFLDSTGQPYPGVKVWHFVAGTSTPASVWRDEGKSVAAENPVVGDSAGRVSFYGDGDYRLRVETAAGILLYDFDNVRVTKDQATEWSGNRGTTYPALTSLNRGQMFALLDAYSAIVELGINDDGNAFHAIPANIATSAKLDLPTASKRGRLRAVTDSTRGVWMDTGGQWFEINGQVVNVQDFDARPGSASDQSAAFQAAADALGAAGGGILLIPPGTYQVNQFTIGDNTWVRGSGLGSTILESSSTSGSTGLIVNSGTQNLRVSDLTLRRTVDVPGVGFVYLLLFAGASLIAVDHCKFVGAGVSATSSNTGLAFSGCTSASVTDCHFVNLTDTSLAVSGGSNVLVHGCAFGLTGNWTHKAIWLQSSVADVFVENCVFAATTGRAPTLVQLGAATNVLISGCRTTNANLVGTDGAGSRVRVVDNVVDHGDITFNTGAQAWHVIARNTVLVGQIIVMGLGGTAAKVRILDNEVDGQSDAGAGPSSYGMLVSGAISEIQIRGNIVHHMQGGGFGISGGQIHVRDNTSYSNGLGGGSANGMQEGFYFTAVAANVGKGIAINNLAFSNARYGYQVDGTQNLSWIDNEGHDNTTGIFSIVNATATGSQPFDVVRMRYPTLASSYRAETLITATWCNAGSVFFPSINSNFAGKNLGIFIHDGAVWRRCGWDE